MQLVTPLTLDVKFITESIIIITCTSYDMHLKVHTVTQLCIHAYPFSGSSAFTCFGNCALSQIVCDNWNPVANGAPPDSGSVVRCSCIYAWK